MTSELDRLMDVGDGYRVLNKHAVNKLEPGFLSRGIEKSEPYIDSVDT